MLLTLPNLLTGLRFISVPLILYFFFSDNLIYQIIATVLFIAAAITDHIDGKIARSRKQVTQFGKFADPLADKLLTLSVFTAIVLRDEFAGVATYLAVWVAIIAFREIGITVLRIWAIRKETTLITSIWGKLKTTVQLTTIIFTLVVLNLRAILQRIPEGAAYYPGDQIIVHIVHGLFILCMLVTVISGILYLNSSRFEPKNETV